MKPIVLPHRSPRKPGKHNRKKHDRFKTILTALLVLIVVGAGLALLGHEVLGAEIVAAALVALTGILRGEIPRE